MAPLADASSASLHPLVTDHVEPGATVITDGWQGTEDWTGSAMVTTRGVSARLRPAEKTEQAAARCAPRRLAGQAMAPGAPPGLWRSVRSTPRRSGAVQALAAPDEGGPIDIEVHDAAVILSGRVTSLTYRGLAEVLGWGTHAAWVDNRPEGDPPRSDNDEEITGAVRTVLEKDRLQEPVIGRRLVEQPPILTSAVHPPVEMVLTSRASAHLR
jgi:hypothetical protein